MKTIAQKKAKINGWIEEYKKRIQDYKLKYGNKSFKALHYQRSCIFKIQSWRLELKSLNKKQMIDKFAIAKFILLKSNEYFGKKITFGKDGKGSNLEYNPERYFVSKFIVDNGLGGEQSAIALKSDQNRLYSRRDMLTKSKEHKNAYRAYKLTMLAELESAGITYK